LKNFLGYHSEWNLGSPGGWDYQRVTQVIGKAVWERFNEIGPIEVKLDFDHPLLFPVTGFVDMLVEAHRSREGNNRGLIAVVAEEETLEDVTENKNLVQHLNAIDGISSALMAPHSLELNGGRVCWKGQPISVIFMDFNTDILLKLHRIHNLSPLLQAVREQRVINPRGTEPINVKSMYEIITGPAHHQFHTEIVQRTPWTRQFYSRRTNGPGGEAIDDLIDWTHAHWENLVLKPERGYSGKGVLVGKIDNNAKDAVNQALKEGHYIVQEKIPLDLWAEEIPTLVEKHITLEQYQTDFRCLLGPKGLFGFLGRYGGVPTNVGSGGGVQPLGILRSDMSVREAVDRINDAILNIEYGDLLEVVDLQKKMALAHNFTYLLGPIKIALRPRVITTQQLDALESYCSKLWADCLTLEKMWLSGKLDDIIKIEEEELEIARWHPWGGSPAIIASDGLFSFGANPEPL
jgi:hypothetical protein